MDFVGTHQGIIETVLELFVSILEQSFKPTLFACGSGIRHFGEGLGPGLGKSVWDMPWKDTLPTQIMIWLCWSSLKQPL